MIFLYLRAHHHLVLIMSDTSNRLNVAVMLAFDAYMAVDWPPESPDNQYHLNK